MILQARTAYRVVLQRGEWTCRVDCWFVACLLKVPATRRVHLRDGSHATLRKKFQLKLVISLNHIILTPGQPVPATRRVHLRDGSAATLRKELQLKLAISLNHIILTPGQPVLAVPLCHPVEHALEYIMTGPGKARGEPRVCRSPGGRLTMKPSGQWRCLLAGWLVA